MPFVTHIVGDDPGKDVLAVGQRGLATIGSYQTAVTLLLAVLMNRPGDGKDCKLRAMLEPSQSRRISHPQRDEAGFALPTRLMGNGSGRTEGNNGPGMSVITKVKPRAKRPNLYRVLILNDDYTPMEFVVHVLERFFQKDVEAATTIMLHVHHHGIGECGVYTYEIAETKVTQVMDFARKHQHPLQCVMEKK